MRADEKHQRELRRPAPLDVANDSGSGVSERRRGWRPQRLTVVVLLVGLAVTAVLSWTSQSQYERNENRLLALRVKEAGFLISGALPGIQTPLASAALLANATGSTAEFTDFMGGYVGPGGPFVSASLWPIGQSSPAPVAVVGRTPALPAGSSVTAGFVAHVAAIHTLSVTGILGSGQDLRLGYAFTTSGAAARFVAYGEGQLPSDRHARIASNSAFADLDYAIYLGRSEQPAALLTTSLSRLPIRGRHTLTVVPFGNSAFTLVMSPRGPLTGALPHRLPWLIVLIGGSLTIAGGAVAERLVRRRETADDLAREIEKLYSEQRSVAQTLQHALLPEDLPTLEDADIGVYYMAATRDMEIGGDWYDVIVLDESRTMLVVGDVSGRGVRAATIMASLRYAIRAYAAQGDTADLVLTKLSRLVSVEATGHFATVLCVTIDNNAHTMAVANAGHLPPLLANGNEGHFVPTTIGPPVGVSRRHTYEATTVTVPPKGTLLMFTDGLVERRGESLDIGLNRLHEAAVGRDQPLEEILVTIVADLIPGGAEDDAAILGVRWHN